MNVRYKEMENNQPGKKKSSMSLSARILAIFLAVLMAGGTCALLIELIVNLFA